MARKFIYEPIEKECPICGTKFNTSKDSVLYGHDKL